MTDTQWTHAHTFTLHGACAEVFRRVDRSQSELERWFAEHVTIEARDGGVFRFWGRHTYGAPGERMRRAASCATSANAAMSIRVIHSTACQAS